MAGHEEIDHTVESLLYSSSGKEAIIDQAGTDMYNTVYDSDTASGYAIEVADRYYPEKSPRESIPADQATEELLKKYQ
jgi:hypothetical protein